MNLKLFRFFPCKHGNYSNTLISFIFTYTPQIVKKSDTTLLGKLHSKAIIHLFFLDRGTLYLLQ